MPGIDADASSASETLTEYSVTDPGYETDVSDGLSDADQLAQLYAENTKKSPPEKVLRQSPETRTVKPPETSGDASDSEVTEMVTDGAEELETPTDDDDVEGDEITDGMLDRAFDLGYTPAELKQFTSPKELAAELDRATRIQARLKMREAPKPVIEPDPEPDWEAMIADGNDPKLVDTAKANWQAAQRANQLVQELTLRDQQREFEQQCERFDSGLDRMTEFKDLFGQGRRGELSKSHVRNRQAVFTQMQVLTQGYQAAGLPVPSESVLLKQAVQSQFSDHSLKVARGKLKADIQEAGSQSLSRPNSGGAKPLVGDDLAREKERRFWKQHSND